MNDPNGLFKDSNGTWHMYYQYNPTNITAGNQHWGHATSPDLYHWENKPIALFPPSEGVGVFTGSVVTDPNNTSGFFQNNTGGVVAIYTLNYPAQNGTNGSQVQALAYSTDNGNTFTPFEGNPVLTSEQYSGAFRDPKVIRYNDKWIMAIAASDARKVQFFSSDNLKNWTLTSEMSNEAIGQVQWECPNLVRVGDKWVLILSTNNGGPFTNSPGGPYGGSTTHYWTGDFNGTHFTPANENAKLAEWGPDGYAGQVFYPDGDNGQTVYINWANNWAYVGETPTASEWWRSAMSGPRLLTLANGTDGEILVQQPYNPAPILGPNVIAAAQSQNGTLNYTYDATSTNGSMLLLLNVSGLATDAAPSSTVNWTFFSADKKEWLESGYALDGRTWIRRGKVGSFNIPTYATNLNTTYPVPKAEGNGTSSIHFAVVVDRSLLETYIDGGKSVATNVFYSNATLNQLGLWADLPQGANVHAMLYGLNSVWANATAGAGGNATQPQPQPQPSTQPAPQPNASGPQSQPVPQPSASA